MKTFKQWKSILFLLIVSVIGGCIEEEVLPQNELVALAGTDKTIQTNEEVLLDGSASHDKKNKPFTYQWTVKAQPQSSAVQLLNTTTSKATFKTDVAGIYVLLLKISSGQFSSSDEVMVTVTAVTNAPTAVVLNEDINTDKTLVDIFDDPMKPDYIVTNNINVRANLEIMPGVVIAFQQDLGLQMISGSFKAVGTPTNEIIFKGIVGGLGYWKGIAIHSNDESNVMEFVDIRGGGSSAFAEIGSKANLALAGTSYSGASLKIKHTVFSGSGGYGLYVQGMSTLTQFANNEFINNIKPAYVSANQLHKIDVVSFINSDGIIETGGVVSQQGEIVWKKLTGYYTVISDIIVKTGITIEAGASFKMKASTSIKVSDTGYLKSIGTLDLRIKFSSTGTSEYWDGILFNSWNENNKLNFCEVSNAGMNVLGDVEYKANVSIGSQGLASIENSIFKNGKGFGVVAKSIDRINSNVALVNNFEGLPGGKVYPDELVVPNKPPVTGVWLDQWSFNRGETAIVGNFYDQETGFWFTGATTPWTMTHAAFGIRFDENGNFTWLIAEHSPWSGCTSYSAEYITGKASITSNKITFDMEYWRSKFYNSCDESQNVDTGVETFELELPYQISKKVNVTNGAEYWEIKFTNPDNSTFSFYRY